MAAADFVVNGGKGLITALLVASTIKYIGWGTSATTAAATDTALGTAAAEARVAATQSQVTTTTANDTYQLVGTITSASGQTILENGVFDASTAGNMFAHHTYATGVGLATGDAIQHTNKYKAA